MLFLSSLLSGEAPEVAASVVLYTSFGVVRGNVRSGSQPGNPASDGDGQNDQQVLRISEATVEHYSSHLPTASFDQLYVLVSDVLGFAVENIGGHT